MAIAGIGSSGFGYLFWPGAGPVFGPAASASRMIDTAVHAAMRSREGHPGPQATRPTPFKPLAIEGGDGVATNITGISGVTAGLANIRVNALATAGQMTGSAAVSSGAVFAGGGSVTISGPQGNATLTTTAGETVGQFLQAVNAANIGVSASLNSSGKVQLATSGVGSSQTVAVTAATGSDVTTLMGLGNGAASGSNATATVNGVTFTGQGNEFHVYGLGAGSLTGLRFTAAATGTTQVSITPNLYPVQTPPTPATSAQAHHTMFSPGMLAQASGLVADALVMQQFALQPMRQQAIAYGVAQLFS